MTNYLAVIKDSLRAALASRVLWLLLVLITLLLVGLAPFGYREVLTTQLVDSDLREPFRMIELLRTEGVKDEPSPSKRIWSLLEDSLRERLEDVEAPGVEGGNPFEMIGTLNRFRRGLNELIDQQQLYDEDSWKGVEMLTREGKELLEKKGEEAEQLSDTERRRLNRLLLEAAYPDLVRLSPPTSVQFTYLWMNVGAPQPLSGEQITELLEENMARRAKWLVGVFGVFVAILVTASVIPRMFEAGSLHLLLSKPVSRWLLFLAQYCGGCAFIFVAATYLVGGLWLILGIRYGVWQPKLLLSIPIYLFVFAVYYSVSALAGVVWRSGIIAIAISILFWAACAGVGWAKGQWEAWVLEKVQLVKLVQAGDELIAINEMGFANVWDDQQREWREIFASGDQQQMRIGYHLMPTIPRELRPLGPVYDQARDRLVSVVLSIGGEQPNLQVFSVGDGEQEWESRNPDTKPPLGTIALLREPDGRILLVSTRLGLFRIEGDLMQDAEPITLFGLKLPFGSGPLRHVGPEPSVVLTQPADAAINGETGEIALYSRSTITLLARDERGNYEEHLEHKLEGEQRQAVQIAFAGSTLLVGRTDGRVQVLDAETLEQRGSFQPEKSAQPRFLVAAPGGKWFAVLFHNGRLYLYDAASGQLSPAAVAGQGDISGVAFPSQDQLLVADRISRVSRYAFPSLKLEQRLTPEAGFLHAGYQYGLVPLYTVFPKPGELDQTFDYLLSGKTTTGEDSGDLEAMQQTIDPWTPVWSSALFTLAVLVIACIYIERQEF